MTVPLTDRKRALLRVLLDERDDLANDLSTGDVNWRAFQTRVRETRCRNELGDLERRGLVQATGLKFSEWRITEAGAEAVQETV